MFHSGEWDGYWKQGRMRGRMSPLVLAFSPDGAVVGCGVDSVGTFTFHGTFDAQGEVTMRKRYLGQHAVEYRGRADGNGGIAGQWTIDGFMSGEFALYPANCEPDAAAGETAAKPRKRAKAKPADADRPLPPAAITPAEPDRPSPLQRRRSPPPPTS